MKCRIGNVCYVVRFYAHGVVFYGIGGSGCNEQMCHLIPLRMSYGYSVLI